MGAIRLGLVDSELRRNEGLLEEEEVEWPKFFYGRYLLRKSGPPRLLAH